MLKHFSTGIQKKYILAAILIVLPLVLLEIWAVNRLSTLGFEINKLENTSSALQLENQILVTEIAKRSSLQQVEQKSKLLGFEKVKSIQRIDPVGLALNR